MKNRILLLALSALFLSCSSDDSGGSSVSAGDYLPLTAGNYWTYNVTNDSAPGTLRDSLYISGDTIVSGESYKKFKTLNLASGFYSGSMANNAVRKVDDKLLLSGAASVNISEDFPFAVAVSDLVILKENASANQVLATVTGSEQQPYDGYDLKFDYTLTSKSLGSMETHNINGETYNDIKGTNVTLTLKITAIFQAQGTTIPVTVLDTQDVLSSNHYFAEGVGVVHVSTDIAYQLEDFSLFPIDLPIPSSGNVHQEEVLDVYVAN